MPAQTRIVRRLVRRYSSRRVTQRKEGVRAGRRRAACHPSRPCAGSRQSRKHRSRPTRCGHPGNSSVRRVGPVCPEVVRVAMPSERAGGRDGPLVSQCTQGTASRLAARRIGPLPSGGPSRVALGLRVGDRSARLAKPARNSRPTERVSNSGWRRLPRHRLSDREQGAGVHGGPAHEA